MLADRYVISQFDSIILYGYNHYCKRQVSMLTAKGYLVTGIIDCNADKLQDNYCGVPITNSISEFGVSDKTVVFIMLQNGMQHYNVAKELYDRGVTRIVFLPMDVDKYNDGYIEFFLEYNYMIAGDYDVMKVPYLVPETFQRKQRSIIRIATVLDNAEYIVWFPIDLIRTTLNEVKQYRDIPLVKFSPYITFFRFLEGNEKLDISEYIRLYGFAPYSYNSIEAYKYTVRKRKPLYQFFESRFAEGDMKYFEAVAPKVTYNTNGYVNLCEGQHRCIYLYLKGMCKLPVRITKEELENIVASIEYNGIVRNNKE